MKVKKYGRGQRLLGVVLAALTAATFAAAAGAQEENIGKVQQGITGAPTISPQVQEEFGLLSLSTGCSGVLLRNNWLLTAAHCVDRRDPDRVKEFIPVPENSVTVTANWKNVQTLQSVRIIRFRPMDVALIRVASPFTVAGSSGSYNRDIFRGATVPVKVMAFGRGIFRFAQGSGPNAMPSQGDGRYRIGYFTTNEETNDEGDNLVWYPAAGGLTIAGGDSGGPSFASVSGRHVILGVHARCTSTCMEGKNCVNSDWTWITSTPACADAPVAPLWDEIDRYLGAFTPPNPDPPLPPIAPPGPTIVPAFIYSVGGDGLLQWHRHDGARPGTGLETAGSWQGARPVGRGWSGMEYVFSGGGNIIYAITTDGTLKWYEHKGFNTGLGLESAGSWEGGKDVGRGWEGLRHVFSGGGGVIYSVTPDGKLWWQRHAAYRTGAGLETPGSWEGGREVGRGWNGLRQVFSAGDGIIYAVKADGKLWWYRHRAYRTGAGLETPGAWEGGREVGRGWGSASNVFALLPGAPDIVR